MKFNPANKKKFIQARDQMPSKYLVFLTPYTENDYTDMKAACYLSLDKQAGYVLTADNDLISVFSLPGANLGKAAVMDAIENGAKTLDCVGEFLAGYYSGFGFIEVKREKWDDRYAPAGWDYDTFGRPDIIYMQR